MIRAAFHVAWAYQQATYCAGAYEHFGIAAFAFVLFFCMLGNSLVIHWYRHGG
jgi:hypothetical protein